MARVAVIVSGRHLVSLLRASTASLTTHPITDRTEKLLKSTSNALRHRLSSFVIYPSVAARYISSLFSSHSSPPLLSSSLRSFSLATWVRNEEDAGECESWRKTAEVERSN